MVSKQSGFKSNWKFIVEIVHKKALSIKEELLIAILERWNHFDKKMLYISETHAWKK